MRTLTIAAIAMLVVLAGSGFAGAADLTLTIDLADSQLAVGETTTYTVYGMVTDNTTNDGFGDPVFSELNGGLISYMVDQTYTGTGTAKHARAPGPPIPTFTAAATTIQAPYGAATHKGDIVNTSWVPDSAGTGGVDNTFGTQLPLQPYSLYDYYEPSKRPGFEYGNATPVALFTGTIEALALGTVDVQVNWEPGHCSVYKVDSAGLHMAVPDTVVPGMATLLIVPEPATLGLLALGGLALLRRTRRK